MNTTLDFAFFNALLLSWRELESASKILLIYSISMSMAVVATYFYSLGDERTLREIGVWVKPMKFMAATALFSLTTVWVVKITHSSVEKSMVFEQITALIIFTSLFEVLYISFQAYKGEPSHYNNSDAFHSTMFAIMGVAAVGLVSSQAWLGWEIWKEQAPHGLSVLTLSVILGLGLTFLLSLLSGFFLGGNQPPSGQGLPIVGWHLYKDIRPAHFLGVHAQQILPLFGLMASQFLGHYAMNATLFFAMMYVALWTTLTSLSF